MLTVQKCALGLKPKVNILSIGFKSNFTSNVLKVDWN